MLSQDTNSLLLERQVSIHVRQRAKAYEYRSTTVCIDSYDRHVLKGRIYNPYFPDGAHFESFLQFLIRMEQMLDTMEFPQPASVVRTFLPPAPPGLPNRAIDTHTPGKLATFQLRVLFRQNTSWQGMVAWVEQNQEQGFRSVLELALLMDNALTSQPE